MQRDNDGRGGRSGLDEIAARGCQAPETGDPWTPCDARLPGERSAWCAPCLAWWWLNQPPRAGAAPGS